MVASTTPRRSKKPLAEALAADFPEFRFKTGSKFAWKPPRTVVIGPSEPFSDLLLLHELGHATLGHTAFKTHVERLKMEVAAWEVAKTLSEKYSVPYHADFVETQLDTYRDWLHQKSRCPRCGLTRAQTASGVYFCPRCDA